MCMTCDEAWAQVTVSIYQEAIGRFISRSEALRIAREILDQAEEERLVIAEYEAARGGCV